MPFNHISFLLSQVEIRASSYKKLAPLPDLSPTLGTDPLSSTLPTFIKPLFGYFANCIGASLKKSSNGAGTTGNEWPICWCFPKLVIPSSVKFTDHKCLAASLDKRFKVAASFTGLNLLLGIVTPPVKVTFAPFFAVQTILCFSFPASFSSKTKELFKSYTPSFIQTVMPLSGKLLKDLNFLIKSLAASSVATGLSFVPLYVSFPFLST